jgi:hypothetical protein
LSGPSRAEIFWLRAGTGLGRPWIKLSARKAKKYKNPTEILNILANYMENNSV